MSETTEPSQSPPPKTPDAESPPWGNTTKAIVASAALILGAMVIWRFQFLLGPLTLAAVFAYLLHPLIDWVQQKTKIGRSAAVLIVYATVLVVLGSLGTAAGVALAAQGARLWSSLPDFLPRLVEQVRTSRAGAGRGELVARPVYV